MISEPYKIKEVKKYSTLKPYERWNILKKVNFNTFHISSDYVNFDLIARGMSAWSHFQKAGFMIGDEAYAGSQNYRNLEASVRKLLGIEELVPTHNLIGAEKLLVTTLLEPEKIVLHNRGYHGGLIPGGQSIDITTPEAAKFQEPDAFGGNVDLDRLEKIIEKEGNAGIAFIIMAACPGEWNGQPFSLENIKEVQRIAQKSEIPLVIDISNLFVNAYWISKSGEKMDVQKIVHEIVGCADIVLMDASQDCRADVGGFIASKNRKYYENFRNQVVVFEGLHTYGGMTGRAMEVFSIGLEEAGREEYVQWYTQQVGELYTMLVDRGIPVHRGGKGIALDSRAFLPHLHPGEYPKFVLAASLYMHGSIRARIDGTWKQHTESSSSHMLMLELPKCAYTINHLREVARRISSVYEIRNEISGLKLINEPEFVDEAMFKPHHNRLFVPIAIGEEDKQEHCEPYKIAIFEPVNISDKKSRWKAIESAGFNTFLLNSDEVYIDLLTDSGTSAMSCYQWEGMTNSSDTPYSSRHYLDLVREFGDILGYNYIIPTHQGRAAEHIMSQVLIRPGQIVPGNMYFTTTKLHQEMAGGIFRDIIVDQAHDPQNDFPWKGNIDTGKLIQLINEEGADKIAYISFELSVNMAGGQPFSMENVREVSRICQKHGILIMFDATRCVENAHMIKMKDPRYAHCTVKEILQEIMSYGDGCAISCKKDFLVNMGGILACNSMEMYKKFQRMLRIWEGDITNGGLDPKDMEALHRGLLDSIDDSYIMMRVDQTQQLGYRLSEASIPIVMPPGSHAIFLDAKRFFPHIDQDQFPAQSLSAALYIQCGVRSMERGNVSKGRDPKTGNNYRPNLELVRLTIPRRVYTNSHIDYVIEGIKELYQNRDSISGLRFTYEPPVLRFFQSRFEPVKRWGI